MMTQLSPGWEAEVDRGPDWLFVRLHGLDPFSTQNSAVSEPIWKLLEQGFAHRLVVELDDLTMLPSQLIGELVVLHKRICANGGMMRLCGLSDSNYAVLETSRLSERFPRFQNREAAVMGRRPKPR